MKILDHYYFYGNRGMGSNSILIDASPKVIVDTGMNPRGLSKRMAVDGFLPEEIGMVVNTHSHIDHTTGNRFFRRRGAKVLTCLGEYLDLKDVCLKVISTPGHSPGSVCLYDEDNRVLISGDTILPYCVGRWDLPGGDIESLKRSVLKLSELKVDYILPGHMYPLTKKRDILESMNAIMEMLGI
ncbi:MAG: MBL fold metallo-hydrolase [Candidatus Methanolliviera hydrocarbonicum]|jgi:Zn-dependent hydrolases, including glyoxylases|uniref:MBL fold metallo-hydrolase n=1 Tax=Candidatus Methanolliviera hydrocarbonicum TaxID=2491085 RepID=A0A520KXV3_9EURY|nr:MAG: MBL fold metallo-hydrolase [Candidatus Methanolliviera hydrocarbonicum]